MTSLLNLLLNTGPTGGLEGAAASAVTDAGTATLDLSGPTPFASSLAGLLGSTSPPQTAAYLEDYSADGALDGLGEQVGDTGKRLPAAGSGRQFTAAVVSVEATSDEVLTGEEQRQLRASVDVWQPVAGAVSASTAPGPTDPLAIRGLEAPMDATGRSAQSLELQAEARAGMGNRAGVASAETNLRSDAQRGDAQRGDAQRGDPQPRDARPREVQLSDARRAASVLTAVRGLQATATGRDQSDFATPPERLRPADAVGALRNPEIRQRRYPFGMQTRVEGPSPASQTGTPGAGAGAAATATAGAGTAQAEPGSAAVLAAMLRSQGSVRDLAAGGSVGVSDAARGTRRALSVYTANSAAAGDAGPSGSSVEMSSRPGLQELRGVQSADGSVLGVTPAAIETLSAESVHIVRTAGTMAEAAASAKPADTSPGTGVSLADGQEAAETLVQRMLQSQAQQLSSIRFQLRPAELGHLDVQMQWRGDQLQLAFTAQHAAARDLIQGHLPHLRQLLQDMGLQLAAVDVRLDSDMKDSAQRQHYLQPGQREGQNAGQNAGQHSDQQTSAHRDSHGQNHPGSATTAAADDVSETGGAEVGGVPSAEAESPRLLSGIDAFV